MYTMEIYSAIRNDKYPPFASTWMELEAPSTVWLLWTLLLSASGCRCPGVSLHLYLWGKSPEVQLLGRRAGLFLTL